MSLKKQLHEFEAVNQHTKITENKAYVITVSKANHLVLLLLFDSIGKIQPYKLMASLHGKAPDKSVYWYFSYSKFKKTPHFDTLLKTGSPLKETLLLTAEPNLNKFMNDFVIGCVAKLGQIHGKIITAGTVKFMPATETVAVGGKEALGTIRVKFAVNCTEEKN